VAQAAVGPQGTKASGVMRTRSDTERRCGSNVQVGALFTLRADTPTAVLFALSLASQIKSVGKVASVGLFAEAALVMLAYEVAHTGALTRRSVVSVGTVRAQPAVALPVLLAYGTVGLGRLAIGRICGLEEG